MGRGITSVFTPWCWKVQQKETFLIWRSVPIHCQYSVGIQCQNSASIQRDCYVEARHGCVYVLSMHDLAGPLLWPSLLVETLGRNLRPPYRSRLLYAHLIFSLMWQVDLALDSNRLFTAVWILQLKYPISNEYLILDVVVFPSSTSQSFDIIYGSSLDYRISNGIPIFGLFVIPLQLQSPSSSHLSSHSIASPAPNVTHYSRRSWT